MLSYGAWKDRFNSIGDVIGKTLEINGATFTVVGVAPQGFLGLAPSSGRMYGFRRQWLSKSCLLSSRMC
jgi:hypothetical protein